MNQELSNVHAPFRKGRGARDQITNINLTKGKVMEFQKTSASSSLMTGRSLTMWCESESVSCSVMSDSATPIDYSLGGSSVQEYWSGFPFPFLGKLPDPEIKPGSPALLVDCLSQEGHHNKLWKILEGIRIPDKLTCLLRSLDVRQ